MQKQEIGKIVDLSRYPLDRPHSKEYQRLIADKRGDLETQQYCCLPGFLIESCRLEIVSAVNAQLQNSNRADNQRNIYLEQQPSPSLPDDHPKNIFSRGCYNMMGTHLLQTGSPLRSLYYSESMQQFVARIVARPRLYPSADPYQPVNVLCHGEGDRSAWHFDSSNAFTMTLMLQAPESGGEFQMAPNTRTDADPNYSGVTKLLQGDESRVIRISRSEGELVIFRGCNSAHRVTPIIGKRRRMMCVMVYENEPGVIGDPIVNETVYGIKKT